MDPIHPSGEAPCRSRRASNWITSRRSTAFAKRYPFLRTIRVINSSEEKLTDLILQVKGAWSGRGMANAIAKSRRGRPIRSAPSRCRFLRNTCWITNGWRALRMWSGSRSASWLEQTFPYEVFAYNEWCGLIFAALDPGRPGVAQQIPGWKNCSLNPTCERNTVMRPCPVPRKIRGGSRPWPRRYEAAEAWICRISTSASFEETGRRSVSDQITRAAWDLHDRPVLRRGPEQCGCTLLLIKAHSPGSGW